ncbi:putative signal transducing protein [Undibacterium terreum]|uniref:DUF2007 domain-containing protein n=1 Tax=Undibacterium terreum TaxID=1224302 RepID=A0A916U4G6_9BURK|nr:DUF2007 domain-containing protein [Undibacterium terreum]GGC60311.1 hypothetical protein GCM10011396_03990 [Undibacterium terreum]
MTDAELEKLAPRSLRLAARLMDVALVSFACWLFALWELISAATACLAWMAMVIGIDMVSPGSSPGKRVFRIAVASDRNLQACSRLQAAGRNLPLLFLPVLDWGFIFCRDRRRIGDNLCNTLVIKSIHLRTTDADPAAENTHAQEQMSLETIAVFGSMLDAEILSARLNADGIPAIVVDGNLVQAYSLIAIAVGGVRVQVMAEHAQRARELLKVLNEGGLMIES